MSHMLNENLGLITTRFVFKRMMIFAMHLLQIILLILIKYNHQVPLKYFHFIYTPNNKIILKPHPLTL